MKRIFLVLLLLAGGWWMSQPQGRSALRPALTQISKLTQTAQTRRREASAPAPPSTPQLSRMEKILCDMANAERRKRGLPLMQIVPALAEVARGHSREMMHKGYFAHESPVAARRTAQDRYALKFAQRPMLIAENIFMLQGPRNFRLMEAHFRKAHEGWMKSPGHRANILRTQPASPTQIGVGIAVKGGSFWATQNFARP